MNCLIGIALLAFVAFLYSRRVKRSEVAKNTKGEQPDIQSVTIYLNNTSVASIKDYSAVLDMEVGTSIMLHGKECFLIMKSTGVSVANPKDQTIEYYLISND